MGNLIYTALMSLDGFVEDAQGKFDWGEPGETLHRYINQLEAKNRLLLLGRKMYETMAFWENPDDLKDYPAYIQEFGQIWRHTEKYVYSRTLVQTSTVNTRLKPNFDPAEIRRLKQELTGAIAIGGAELAGLALAHGLVDELRLFIFPVVVGNGKPALSRGTALRLQLMESQDFEGGIVYLRYLMADPSPHKA